MHPQIGPGIGVSRRPARSVNAFAEALADLESPTSGRSVTSKVVSILELFREGREHTLTEVATLTGLPMSTAHRIVSELASSGLLDRPAGRRLRAGLPLRMMGVCDLHPIELRERAPRVLEDLAGATGCRALLGVLEDREVAYIEKWPGPRPVSRFGPSAKLPVHATAVGRALLAFAPPGMVEAVILQGLRPYTRFTVTSPERLRRALCIVRATRVSAARFEFEVDTCAVAVPVFGPGGRVVAAIELTVPDLGRRSEPFMAALYIASRSLSRELVDAVMDDARPVPRLVDAMSDCPASSRPTEGSCRTCQESSRT